MLQKIICFDISLRTVSLFCSYIILCSSWILAYIKMGYLPFHVCPLFCLRNQYLQMNVPKVLRVKFMSLWSLLLFCANTTLCSFWNSAYIKITQLPLHVCFFLSAFKNELSISMFQNGNRRLYVCGLSRFSAQIKYSILLGLWYISKAFNDQAHVCLSLFLQKKAACSKSLGLRSHVSVNCFASLLKCDSFFLMLWHTSKLHQHNPMSVCLSFFKRKFTTARPCFKNRHCVRDM